jgi:DeoR/GlpR family transcriptional regulator of sugar metabolism
MNKIERHRLIQEALSRQDFVSLEEICTRLGASPATARRDLVELECEHLVRRVRGGVLSITSREDALDYRQLSVSCQEEKARIGKLAAKQIMDGQTVIMGGGSTVAEVAKCLLERPIQIITNSIPVAHVFWDCRQTEVTMTGGSLYPRLGIQFGPLCERMLHGISADVAILGIRGITADGLSDSSTLVVESIRAMMKSARRVIVVADHTKFGRNAMVHVADLSEVDQIVTDRELAEEHCQLLRSHNLEFQLA